MQALRLVFLLLCTLGATVAQAAPPPCWPSITNPPQHVEETEATLSNGDKYWATWRCPDGLIYMGTFSVSRILPWVVKVSAGLMTDEEANAAFEAWPKITDEENQKLRRMIMVNYYDAQPMTISTVVYRTLDAVNMTGAIRRFGTIELGKPCEKGGRYNTLMVVNRADVKKDVSTSQFPPVVRAPCG